jgi:hypothetical protein
MGPPRRGMTATRNRAISTRHIETVHRPASIPRCWAFIIPSTPQVCYRCDVEVQYRFNRRFNLDANPPRLLRAIAATLPQPSIVSRMAEVRHKSRPETCRAQQCVGDAVQHWAEPGPEHDQG